VQPLPLRPEQALVGGVAHQGVLEAVGRLGRLAAREDQLRRGQPLQRRPQLRLRHRRDRREQRVVEFAPEAGGHLRHLLDPGHAVEPGHQRGVQRGRHRGHRPGLQHRLGQLLDEQRHPVRPGRDLAQHLRRQDPVAGEAGDDRLGRAAAEAVQREPGHVRVPAQGRLVVRPAGQQHQYAGAGDPVEREPHQLEGGGVAPVSVLEQHQHRLAACQPEELADQRRQRAGAPLLRGELRQRVAVARLDPQQRRDQRCRLPDVFCTPSQQGLELVEPGRIVVLGLEVGGMGELPDHRPQRRAGVVGGALVAEHRVLVSLDRVEDGAGETRFADPGLADQQYCLAFAGGGLSPALEDQGQLLVAADHWQQLARAVGLEPAVGGALARDPERLHRPREALEPDRAERA
jgi:hypothetical protein